MPSLTPQKLEPMWEEWVSCYICYILSPGSLNFTLSHYRHQNATAGPIQNPETQARSEDTSTYRMPATAATLVDQLVSPTLHGSTMTSSSGASGSCLYELEKVLLSRCARGFLASGVPLSGLRLATARFFSIFHGLNVIVRRFLFLKLR